jgi:polyisoprenoid-binding protein YceI
MKKLFLALGLALFTGFASMAQSTWSVDNAHTKIEFSVSHLVISETVGFFKTFGGTVSTTSDDFNGANIQFTVDVASINTDNEMRDNHLKSDDFFNAEKFPKMTFKSTSFKKVEGKKYKLTGQLTIRDITKTVEFDVVYNGTVKDPYGNTKAGFKLVGSINRFDYGLKWNTMAEAGAVVGDMVEIKINIELAKDKK